MRTNEAVEANEALVAFKAYELETAFKTYDAVVANELDNAWVAYEAVPSIDPVNAPVSQFKVTVVPSDLNNWREFQLTLLSTFESYNFLSFQSAEILPNPLYR